MVPGSGSTWSWRTWRRRMKWRSRPLLRTWSTRERRSLRHRPLLRNRPLLRMRWRDPRHPCSSKTSDRTPLVLVPSHRLPHALLQRVRHHALWQRDLNGSTRCGITLLGPLPTPLVKIATRDGRFGRAPHVHKAPQSVPLPQAHTLQA